MHVGTMGEFMGAVADVQCGVSVWSSIKWWTRDKDFGVFVILDFRLLKEEDFSWKNLP